MAKNSYYYYDKENACFVEVKEKGAKIYARIILIVAGSLALSIALTLGMDRMVQTPQELALLEQIAHYRSGVDALENHIERQADTISRSTPATAQTSFQMVLMDRTLDRHKRSSVTFVGIRLQYGCAKKSTSYRERLITRLSYWTIGSTITVPRIMAPS